MVERILARLLGFRRFDLRYERRTGLLQCLLHLGCALVCLLFVDPIGR